MIENIIAYCSAGALLNFLIFMVSDSYIWMTPIDVYDSTELNWLGATVVYLIMYVISPVWYTLKLIWWLFHIGRK